MTRLYFLSIQAYYHMQSYDLSRQDFAALLKLDPSNKLARNYLANCDKLMKKMDEQSKSIAKKMMSGIGKGKVIVICKTIVSIGQCSS